MQMDLPSLGSGSDCSSDTDLTVYMDYQSEPEVNTPEIENNDFSEYLWMENEEEFDEEVMQRLTEEELMEECVKALSEDEKRNVKFTRLLERLKLVNSDETKEQGDRIVLREDDDIFEQLGRLTLSEDLEGQLEYWKDMAENVDFEQQHEAQLEYWKDVAENVDIEQQLEYWKDMAENVDIEQQLEYLKDMAENDDIEQQFERASLLDTIVVTSNNDVWKVEIAGQSTLNPNAAEFVPAFKSMVTSVSTPSEIIHSLL